MRQLKLLLLLLIVTLAFSQQFEIVKDVTELPGDLTAQRYGYKDVNGQWCAILKVHTNVQDMSFSSTGYEKHDYQAESGIYLVYLQPDTKNLRFMKQGFIAKSHNFPFKLKSNAVYQIDIKGIEEEKKLEDIAITIQSDPPGAMIYIDGAEKGILEQVKTAIGKHELKLTKEGYGSKSVTIEVTAEKTLFKEKLDKIREALIEIGSEPAGATVFINGVEIGTTPVSTFFIEGSYTIKLTGKNTDDLEESIEIKYPETRRSYKLTDVSATLTINTHEKAKVSINGNQVENYKNIKISPQLVTVKVEMNKAKTLEERVILGKKDVKVLDMYPVVPSGTVQVAVIPSDAEIELYETGGERYNSKGSKIFENVPAGIYKMTITKSGYTSFIKDIMVEEGKTVKETGIKLEPADITTQPAAKTPLVSSEMILVQGTETGDFYIGKTEVTQAQYQSVIGKNPSYFKGDDLPVETVSWYDAVEFCNKLSEIEGLTKCYSGSGNSTLCNLKANGYRLPTEAEWEYAAKGGQKAGKGIFGGPKYKYSGSDKLAEVGWYDENSRNKTHAVATKKPNELGIYDMSGNVWEWCWDWYTEGYYRVIRGGSWYFADSYCRITYRLEYSPGSAFANYGFRVVRNP